MDKWRDASIRFLDSDDSTTPRLVVLRLFGAVLPISYVWLLPLLASESIGFANRCPTYPQCVETGVSVSNYICTPSATGMMYACFFYPCLHAWFNVRDLGLWNVEKITVITFQVLFNLFLMFPLIYVRHMHAAVVSLFALFGLAHFCIVESHCVQEMRTTVRVLIVTAMASFFGVFCCGAIATLDKHWLPSHAPHLFYLFEATGLTSIVLLTLLWKGQEWQAHKTVKHSHSAEWYLRLAVTCVPVFYLCLLIPLSAPAVGFGHRCEGWPRCDMFGATLSDFIRTPEATGAMGGVFFYPCLHAWLNVHDAVRHSPINLRGAKVTVVGFQATFGLNLALANYGSHWAWRLPQTFFTVFAIAHLIIMLRLCHDKRHFSMWLCASCVTVTFTALLILTVVGHFDPTLLPEHMPYLYFVLEFIGYSVVAVAPAFFYVDEEYLKAQNLGNARSPL